MLETKYIDLSVLIEKGIKDGLWKERLPSVRELSKELNADPATVSKAFRLLAEKGFVSIQGNKGTFITQPGKCAKHKVIGIVGMSTDNPHYFEELSAMEKTAEASGYKVVGLVHKNDLFVKGINLLLRFPVDGYIFMYSSLSAEIAFSLRENGIPFVACNKPAGIPGVNWVDFDSEKALAKALFYLIGLGHKRIAYIDFYSTAYNFSERILNVYQKVLSESEIPFDKSLFISKGIASYYSIYGENYLKACEAYGADCAGEIMQQKEKPTAVLIAYPPIAYSFIEKLKKHKINVPGDISVISYNSFQDKDEFLTILFKDYERRSSTAVKILLHCIDNPYSEAKQELIASKIIVKKSTSDIRKKTNCTMIFSRKAVCV
ncbi:MAG: GntR family transcriptional regulator [Victivallaceae bacterium]|jgi:DNA-binding LacI/PurR family transcriptional regulator